MTTTSAPESSVTAASPMSSSSKPCFELTLNNRGRATSRVPVTTGICLPRGLLNTASRIAVTNATGEPIETQSDTTSTWSDGSIRWVLLHFVANELPTGQSAWPIVIANAAIPTPDSSVAPIKIGDSQVEVPMDGQQFDLTFPLTVDQSETQPTLSMAQNHGAVHSVSTMTGTYECGLNLTARIHRWQSSPHIRVEIALHNPQAAKHAGGLWDLGDAGSISFEELAVNISTGRTEQLGWTIEGDELEWLSLIHI